VSPICRAQLGESVGLDEPQPFHLHFMPGTGNLLVHRDVFEQVGRFNDALKMGAEDSDLFLRIFQAHIPAWYTSHAIVRHVIPAYRLQPRYFRWNSSRTGATVAGRDRESYGLAGMSARMLGRVAQIALIGALRWLPARLRGDQVTALGWQCRMWRAAAYFRAGLQLLAPRLFKQQAFTDYLDFRSEREMLSDVELMNSLPEAMPATGKTELSPEKATAWANS
jgi:hypothetical protein